VILGSRVLKTLGTIMNKVRNLLLILSISSSISCSSQVKQDKEKKNDRLIVTYEKDGKMITDTIQDPFLSNELNRMMADSNYLPSVPENDTTFDQRGNPVIIKLSDHVFGASIQKLKYDSLNRVAEIAGFNNQGKIKPFYHYIAIERYKYDERGNLIEIRAYGADERLISSKYEDTPVIRKVYNEKNQLIEEWYLDENENLRDEFSILKIEYLNHIETGQL